jgi:hypothetical protein
VQSRLDEIVAEKKQRGSSATSSILVCRLGISASHRDARPQPCPNKIALHSFVKTDLFCIIIGFRVLGPTKCSFCLRISFYQSNYSES